VKYWRLIQNSNKTNHLWCILQMTNKIMQCHILRFIAICWIRRRANQNKFTEKELRLRLWDSNYSMNTAVCDDVFILYHVDEARMTRCASCHQLAFGSFCKYVRLSRCSCEWWVVCRMHNSKFVSVCSASRELEQVPIEIFNTSQELAEKSLHL